jgi:tetratricopeptide (TPR) repeat protein
MSQYLEDLPMTPRKAVRSISSVLFVATALCTTWVFAAGGGAGADAKPKGTSSKGGAAPVSSEPKRDPDNVAGLSMFMEGTLKGNAQYLAKDYQGAIDTYRQAMTMAPKNSLGPYLLGEAQLATNNLAEAEASFAQAESLSDNRNPQLRSHILFCIASTKELRKKFDDARIAWQAYNEHASKFADAGGFPQSATARVQVIDDIVKLNKAYEIVRQRIAAEKVDGGTAPAASGK